MGSDSDTNARRQTRAAAGYRRAMTALRKSGVLLLADAHLPCVSSIVAGAPIRGSWWAHQDAHAIYDVCERLNHHADVTLARLIAGKETYVYRRLWAALAAVGCAGDRWKTDGLSDPALRLLAAVRRRGKLRIDELPPPAGARSWSGAALQLEQRLLLHGESFHTERGMHAKRLQTWQRWAREAGVPQNAMTARDARTAFEAALDRVNMQSAEPATLPWQATVRRRRRRG